MMLILILTNAIYRYLLLHDLFHCSAQGYFNISMILGDNLKVVDVEVVLQDNTLNYGNCMERLLKVVEAHVRDNDLNAKGQLRLY